MTLFESGANRSADTNKLDYEGFLSPIVLEEYAKYMNTTRNLPDGSVRDSDNWQRGIPLKNYIKSLLRHTMDFWKLHRGYRINEIDCFTKQPITIKSTLCAMMFNTMGYLHELLKKEQENDFLDKTKLVQTDAQSLGNSIEQPCTLHEMSTIVETPDSMKWTSDF